MAGTEGILRMFNVAESLGDFNNIGAMRGSFVYMILLSRTGKITCIFAE